MKSRLYTQVQLLPGSDQKKKKSLDSRVSSNLSTKKGKDKKKTPANSSIKLVGQYMRLGVTIADQSLIPSTHLDLVVFLSLNPRFTQLYPKAPQAGTQEQVLQT